MELTKKKINEHKDLIEGLEGYYTITSEIEDNLYINPDISIESCKSLIEGLCKKALESISDKYNSDKRLRKNCEGNMSALVKTAFDEVYVTGIERDLHDSLYSIIKNRVRTQKLVDSAKISIKNDTKKTVDRIAAIRHTRGDISHGRSYPKKIESEIHLALSIKSITDGICSYMIQELAIQYDAKLKLSGQLIYAEQSKYNEWLDDQNDKLTTKIDFSRLLYSNNYEKYEEIYYSDYAESIEMQKDEDIEEVVEVVPEEELKKKKEAVTKEEPKVIVEVKNETIKDLVNNFYEDIFWTEERNLKLAVFIADNNLKRAELKEVVDEYLFTDKLPLPDDVINTLIEKPSLIERKEVVRELTTKIVEFSKDLKQ